MSKLPDWVFSPTKPIDRSAVAAARARQDRLTKPLGALGRLEEIAIQLAGLQGCTCPQLASPHIILFAGDHGIVAEDVSAYPSEVTGQMLANFASGGAAISVLARTINAPLEIVDVGSLLDTVPQGVVADKIAKGTQNFRRRAAMTAEELSHALHAGQRAVQRAAKQGADILLLGEMGIGNTSAASALCAALLPCPARDVVGRGTGLDGDRLTHKVRMIEESLSHHGLLPVNGVAADAERALLAVGGHEIAALTGATLSAAQNGLPVLVDGFICTGAALAAARINSGVTDWLFFAHRSAEAGHRAILDALHAEPLLDLGLRLGEGSGAALAYPLLAQAVHLHGEMATFDDAGVSTSS